MAYPVKQRVGLRHGRLVVKENVEHPTNANRGGLWRCTCDCGNECIVTGYSLCPNASGRRSCGCLRKQNRSAQRRYQATTINLQYRAHVKTAKQRHLAHLGREEWYAIVTQPCQYCGQLDVRSALLTQQGCLCPDGYPPEEAKKYQVLMNGVDRLDAERDYVKDNCVPCCGRCNVMKWSRDPDAFLIHVGRIVARDSQVVASPLDTSHLTIEQRATLQYLYLAFCNRVRSLGDVPMAHDAWSDIVHRPCVYCGEMDMHQLAPSRCRGANKVQRLEASVVQVNGIDRIDPTQGYVHSNMIPCCWACNQMKSDMPQAAFLQHMHTIAHYQTRSLADRGPRYHPHQAYRPTSDGGRGGLSRAKVTLVDIRPPAD